MTNDYGFNAYDAAIALVLTRYLISTGEPKSELEKVIGTGDVDGAALSDLLDRATAWAQEGLQIPSERFSNEMQNAVKEALADFSGKRYVQSMDVGFCRFLYDFYHGRIS